MVVSDSNGGMFDPWAGTEKRRHRSTDTSVPQSALVPGSDVEDPAKLAPLLVRWFACSLLVQLAMFGGTLTLLL